MPPKSGDGRRKSGNKHGLLVTLSVSSALLRDLLDEKSPSDESPVPKESVEPKLSVESPAPSGNVAASNNSIADNVSDSNAATPAAEGTPVPSVMGPPVDGRKRRGVKRSATTIDGVPKPRGKPGPKKKPRLEDGTIDHNAVRAMAVPKLGPKANQGAINAGLRALDRSGKPCRKWARGGFKLKSFTGVAWEIGRWTAPPKKADEEGNDGESAADNSSGKENKIQGQDEHSASQSNSNSNAGGDVEMRSAASANASSPAPIAVSAA